MTYYTVGLVGLRMLGKFPWRDAAALDRYLHTGAGECLPEHIDLDAMRNEGASK